MTSAEIDRAVSAAGREGRSLYQVDVDLVSRLRPDLLLIQSLCDVCATPPTDLKPVLAAVQPRPKVVPQHAHDFEGMFADLRELAEAAGVDAGPLEQELRKRVDAVARRARRLPKRRVFCLEWLDPPFAAGHWVPEMVAMAGGLDGLARPKRDSVRISWESVAEAAPDVLVVMPCGFTLERTRRELPSAARRPEWASLPAVKNGEVYVADGHSYFNGSGPRLVDGLEILAEILHPREFPRRHRSGYFKWRG
ncbi:MAG TPA: ABC transporter substrate-binding protein, partial [Planctomycetota bacterium]|nr:ABC transporter substrate-binding protein [Planctomycetota bacterium]